MPVLEISLHEVPLEPRRDPAEAFAHLTGVSPEHVTVQVMQCHHQLGNRYRARVNLMLPDLLLPDARERFLEAAVKILEPCFDVLEQDVLAYLTLVCSGEVLDRGRLQKWDLEPPKDGAPPV